MATAAPAKPNKFVSFLKAAGKDVEKGLAAIMPIAVGAEPLVDATLPGIGILYNTTVGVVLAVEQKWAGVATETGTGPQKLADATAVIGPLVKQIYALAGHDVSDAEIAEYINAVVALLNAIPAGFLNPPALPAAPQHTGTVADGTTVNVNAAAPATTQLPPAPAADQVASAQVAG